MAKPKKIYSDGVDHFYNVLTNLMNIKLENTNMKTYLGKLDCPIAKFSTSTAFTTGVETF